MTTARPRTAVVTGVLVLLVAGWVVLRAVLPDPLRPVAGAELRPPSPAHPFGTDDIGRDVLARVVAAAPATLGTSAVALTVTIVVGVVLALVAGWAPRRPAARLVGLLGQVLLVLPPLWMPLVVVALLGGGRGALVLAIVLTALPEVLWVMVREVVALRERPFVEAARSLGLGTLRTWVVELVPHLAGSALVLALLHFRQAVLVVATLAFLGLGPPPPTPTWGGMVADGRAYFPGQWWVLAFPTLALALSIGAAGVVAWRLSPTTGSKR